MFEHLGICSQVSSSTHALLLFCRLQWQLLKTAARSAACRGRAACPETTLPSRRIHQHCAAVPRCQTTGVAARSPSEQHCRCNSMPAVLSDTMHQSIRTFKHIKPLHVYSCTTMAQSQDPKTPCLHASHSHCMPSLTRRIRTGAGHPVRRRGSCSRTAAPLPQ